MYLVHNTRYRGAAGLGRGGGGVLVERVVMDHVYKLSLPIVETDTSVEIIDGKAPVIRYQ